MHLRIEERTKRERINANEWRQERGYKMLPAYKHFTNHLKPMFLLSINTGMRRGEVFSLTWSDVDLKRSTLTIKGSSAKSGKTRHIPLNSEALDALKKWKSQSKGTNLVFPGEKGKPLSNIKTAWNNIIKTARVDNFRWHDLRHHFASKLVMESVDLNTVRELLGHGDLKMTLRYAHLAPKKKMEAVEKLIARNKKIKIG